MRVSIFLLFLLALTVTNHFGITDELVMDKGFAIFLFIICLMGDFMDCFPRSK